MRYLVGGGGLAYEAIIDQFHQPIALLVFGALSTSTDVFGFVRTLIQSAREEERQAQRALSEAELARGGEDKG